MTTAFQYKDIQFLLIGYSSNFIAWSIHAGYTRPDHACSCRWLRRKRVEKLVEQQAVKERTRQLRLEAKRSKQFQPYMSDAKSFRFTDHYNWRYLLNTSFWSHKPQNFGYYFCMPLCFGYTLNYGNGTSFWWCWQWLVLSFLH